MTNYTAKPAAIAYALHRCGEGNIQFTLGVLHTLGEEELANEIEFAKATADANYQEAPALTGDAATVLFAPSPQTPAYLEARDRLTKAFRRLDDLRRQYVDGAPDASAP